MLENRFGSALFELIPEEKPMAILPFFPLPTGPFQSAAGNTALSSSLCCARCGKPLRTGAAWYSLFEWYMLFELRGPQPYHWACLPQESRAYGFFLPQHRNGHVPHQLELFRTAPEQLSLFGADILRALLLKKTQPRYNINVMRDIIAIPKKQRGRKRMSSRIVAPAAQDAPTVLPRAVVAASDADGTLSEAETKLPPALSWETAEYAHRPKSADWYWVMGFAAVVVIGVAVFTKNLLLGIFAAISGLTLMLLGSRAPRHLSFSLSPKGVTVHRTFYAYEHLKSFWIRYESDGKKELSLESKKMLMPFVIIPLGQTDPVLVRRFLGQFLREREHEETLLDQLNEHIGL